MRAFVLPGNEWPDDPRGPTPLGVPTNVIALPCANRATAHWFRRLAEFGIIDDFMTGVEVQMSRERARADGCGLPAFYVVVSLSAPTASPFRS